MIGISPLIHSKEALRFLLEKPKVLSAERQILKIRSLSAQYLKSFPPPATPDPSLCDNTHAPSQPCRGNARLRRTLISCRLITIYEYRKKNKPKKFQPKPKLLPKEFHSYFFMHLELINKHEGKKSRLIAENTCLSRS